MRCFSLLLGGLCVLGMSSRVAVAQAPPPTAPPATPAAGEPAPAAEIVAVAEISPDEALQQAIAAFDRLEHAKVQAEREEVLEEATQLTRRLELADPDNAWILYLTGRGYAAVGLKGDAIEDLTKFVESREGRNEWAAYRILGDLFVDGYPNLAKKKYEQANYLKPNEPSVLIGMAVCMSSLGDKEKALEHAESAVSADGGRTLRYLATAARLYMGAGQLPVARRHAQDALERAKQELRVGQTAVELVRQLDAQYQLLYDILTRQIQTTPEDPDLYLALVRYMRERMQVSQLMLVAEAVALLEAGIQRAGGTPPVALLLEYGSLLKDLGRFEDGKRAYEQVLQADPGNRIAREGLDKLNQAQTGAAPAPKP